MRHDVFGPLALTKAVRVDGLASTALGVDPVVDARLTFRGSLRDGGSAQPTGQGEGVRGEFQENPLAELLDGRQPMRTFGERRAANRETDVLEVFRRQRGGSKRVNPYRQETSRSRCTATRVSIPLKTLSRPESQMSR